MHAVYVDRPEYTLAFTVTDDGTEPHLEVEYEGYGDAIATAGSTIAIERDLDLNIRARVTDGTFADDSGMTESINDTIIGKMSASHAHGPNPSRARNPGLYMSHLNVDPEYQRHGIGTYLFDVYRVAAVWLGEYASGKVGSYEKTRDFLVQQGVPATDIREVSGSYSKGPAAAWSTPVENLIENDPGVWLDKVDRLA